MGFNIKNNYGPNIEVNDGGQVMLVQGQNGLWHTEEDVEVQEAEIVEDVTDEIETAEMKTQLNYFAPTKHLQTLLKQDWFKNLRSKNEYDEVWTDAFVSALMASDWRDSIAIDWGVKGERKKINQIKGYVVGLLKDAGVLKGSYDSISTALGITEAPRTFSRYMGEGKKQPYADWVKAYVNGVTEQ